MPTYSEYLQLEGLLALQRPRGGAEEHDEMLFIIIHQVYELWFKQVLHEMDYLQSLWRGGELRRAQHTMKRVLTILKIMVAQIDVLETMTPLEFLTFRERLESGSGFQSVQFRELEFLLGHKRTEPIERHSDKPDAAARLRERYDAPALWDVFVRYLTDIGHDVPDDVLERDVTQPIEPSPALQKTLIHIYKTDPPVAEFCERLVDLDEGIQEWRYRHVKMVERTIGTKRGTGGSDGAPYLKTTLFHPLFPDLWHIRTEF